MADEHAEEEQPPAPDSSACPPDDGRHPLDTVVNAFGLALTAYVICDGLTDQALSRALSLRLYRWRGRWQARRELRRTLRAEAPRVVFDAMMACKDAAADQ